MEIFVINLDRSPERLAHMRVELARLGVSFERMPAVDGSALTTEELRPWTTAAEDDAVVLSAGEIGCILSHRRCWQAAVDAGAPVIVLEDDLFFSADAAAFLSGANWVPDDADIVKLETVLLPTLIDKRGRSVNNRSVVRLRRAHTGTGAYVITPAAAARLLSVPAGGSLPLDHFMFHPESDAFGGLITYQLTPAVCIQEHIISGKRGRRAGMQAIDSARRLTSILQTERVARRAPKPLLTRLQIEVRRPFDQLRTFLTRTLTNAITAQRWTTVEFR